ncbi:MAG: hypothetical protein CMO81_06585 [Waddliaceae bacterium]|nr:hypothetical protein [Waddliaceae bacterium]
MPEHFVKAGKNLRLSDLKQNEAYHYNHVLVQASSENLLYQIYFRDLRRGKLSSLQLSTANADKVNHACSLVSQWLAQEFDELDNEVACLFFQDLWDPNSSLIQTAPGTFKIQYQASLKCYTIWHQHSKIGLRGFRTKGMDPKQILRITKPLESIAKMSPEIQEHPWSIEPNPNLDQKAIAKKMQFFSSKHIVIQLGKEDESTHLWFRGKNYNKLEHYTSSSQEEFKTLFKQAINETKRFQHLSLARAGLSKTAPESSVNVPPPPHGYQMEGFLELFDQIFYSKSSGAYRDPNDFSDDGKKVSREYVRKGMQYFVNNLNFGSGAAGIDQKTVKDDGTMTVEQTYELMRKQALHILKALYEEKNPQVKASHILELAVAGVHCGGRYRDAINQVYLLTTEQFNDVMATGGLETQVLLWADLHKIDIARKITQVNPISEPTHEYQWILKALKQYGVNFPEIAGGNYEDRYERYGKQRYETAKEVFDLFFPMYSSSLITSIIERVNAQLKNDPAFVIPLRECLLNYIENHLCSTEQNKEIQKLQEQRRSAQKCLTPIQNELNRLIASENYRVKRSFKHYHEINKLYEANQNNHKPLPLLKEMGDRLSKWWNRKEERETRRENCETILLATIKNPLLTNQQKTQLREILNNYKNAKVYVKELGLKANERTLKNASIEKYFPNAEADALYSIVINHPRLDKKRKKELEKSYEKTLHDSAKTLEKALAAKSKSLMNAIPSSLDLYALNASLKILKKMQANIDDKMVSQKNLLLSDTLEELIDFDEDFVYMELTEKGSKALLHQFGLLE